MYHILDLIDESDEPDEQTEFIKFYRQQLRICLDKALVQVINERVTRINRTDPEKAQKFLTALQLFHCQGISMTEIAPIVNLPAQFNVSRLLKLKEFRADVRQRLLVLLSARIVEQAKAYNNPEQDKQIEAALDEQINVVIQEGRKEASTPTLARINNTKSLFAKRLCCLLDVMRTENDQLFYI